MDFLEPKIELLKHSREWHNCEHLCSTCIHANKKEFPKWEDDENTWFLWTTWSPNICHYFEESEPTKFNIEDNGGGYWVTKCPDYEKDKNFYYAYMKSDLWKKKRAEIIKRDGYKCTNPKCGSAINLVVHHTTYEHLGYEDDTELITLCKKCHEKLHENDKNGGGN